MNPTINPSELKPAREWLNYLPEPIKSEAIEACVNYPLKPDLHCIFSSCIGYAIFWDDTKDYHKWAIISDRLQSGEILPVSPDQVLTRGTEAPTEQWLQQLPEPYRTAALSQVDKKFTAWKESVNSMDEAIHRFADWEKTKEKGNFWDKVRLYYLEGRSPLPPYPENLLNQVRAEKIATNQVESLPVLPKAEQPKPMTDHEAQIAQLRAEIAAMRKIIEMIKAEPTTEPEPKQVKLPVTIDEVWEQELRMDDTSTFCVANDIIEKSFFTGAKLTTEFRTEKTAKKALAFLTLLKIAEAQNEVTERGADIWYASNDDNTIVIHDIKNTRIGQIYFHSEQGLKDCIAANEQLWKDYLEIGN